MQRGHAVLLPDPQNGGTIVYAPDAVVWHHHRNSVESLRKQIRAFYRGNIAYKLTTFIDDGDVRGVVQIGQVIRWQAKQLRRAFRWRHLDGQLWRDQTIGALGGPRSGLCGWAIQDSNLRPPPCEFKRANIVWCRLMPFKSVTWGYVADSVRLVRPNLVQFRLVRAPGAHLER